MTIPPPEERLDLYDAYDLPATPRKFTTEHWITITPEPIKKMLEAKYGKPFAEIAADMASTPGAFDAPPDQATGAAQ